MNNCKVAWIPTNDISNDFLTEKGVLSIGGRIIKNNLSFSQSESIAFKLTNETKGSQGKYIPVDSNI